MAQTPDKPKISSDSPPADAPPLVANVPADKRGGKRKGAGRPAGAVTSKTRAAAEAFLRSGRKTPLDVLLDNMAYWYKRRHKGKIGDKERARQMAGNFAQAAAPFVHPRLNAVDIGGQAGNPIELAFRDAKTTLASKLAGLLNGHAHSANDSGQAGDAAPGAKPKVSNGAH